MASIHISVVIRVYGLHLAPASEGLRNGDFLGGHNTGVDRGGTALGKEHFIVEIGGERNS